MKIETPFKKEYDFEHLRKVLLRETTQGPVPIFELAVDPEIMSEATGFDFPAKRFDELINIGPDSPPETLELGVKLMDLIIDFYQAVGYDYVVMTPLVFIPRTRMQLTENPQQEGKLKYRPI